MQHAIAGVLFDKDGTLIDFDGTWGPTTHAVIHTLAKGEANLIQAQADALHFSLENRRFLPTSPLIAGSSASYGDLWGKALGRSDLAELRREIDSLTAVESLKALTPIGSPVEVLDMLLAMGLRLGLATNDSQASAFRQVEALGLATRIEFVAGYDSGHGGKPDPGMVLAFARHIGVDPTHVAMVGDSRHDLNAAKAAGALAIAVLTGPAGREELASEADHVIADITALPDLLARLAEGGAMPGA